MGEEAKQEKPAPPAEENNVSELVDERESLEQHARNSLTSASRNLLLGVPVSRRRLPEAKVKKFTRMLLQGISLIDKFGYVHFDLKPDNILVPEPEPEKEEDGGEAQPAAGEEKKEENNAEKKEEEKPREETKKEGGDGDQKDNANPENNDKTTKKG